MRPAGMAGLYNPTASGLSFLSCETDDHASSRASLGGCQGRRPWGANEAGWLVHSFLLSFARSEPRPRSGPEGTLPCAGWPLGPLSGGCRAPGRGGPREAPHLVSPFLNHTLGRCRPGGHRERASLHLGVLSPRGRRSSRADSPHTRSGPAGARKTTSPGWLAGATGSDSAVTPSDGELTPSHALLPNGLKPASLSWTSRVPRHGAVWGQP